MSKIKYKSPQQATRNGSGRVSKSSKVLITCLILFFAVVAIVAILVATSSFGGEISNPQNVRVIRLGEKQQYGARKVVWDGVKGATKYVVNIDGEIYNTADTELKLDRLDAGMHSIAISTLKGKDISDSSAIEYYSYGDVDASAKSDQGLYGAFDEVARTESFLGYGFDVINSSEFSSQTVNFANPIFEDDGLLRMKAVKYKENRSSVVSISESNVDSFVNSWNASLNINVGWPSGSVAVGGSASGDMTSRKSQHFMVFDAVTQNYYLSLQSGISNYRNVISQQFRDDLYDNKISPSELFRTYGTHFITSALMGGRLSSEYYMSSDETTDMIAISAKISAQIKGLFASGGAEGSMDYTQEAAEKHVYISNKLSVFGGELFGLVTDSDIKEYYKDWQESLKDSPALMGVKDGNSLVGLWNLVEPSRDTEAKYPYGGELLTRSAQLQAYFDEYGLASYNKMRKSYGLNEIIPPTDITNIQIAGKDVDKDGVYTVANDSYSNITMTVVPNTAIDYTVSYDIESAVDKDGNTLDTVRIAAIDNDRLRVYDTVQLGTRIRLTIRAGSRAKKIEILVTRFSDVVFDANGGYFDNEAAHEQQITQAGIRSGYKADIPKEPQRDIGNDNIRYVFAGWTTDKEGDNPYNFDTPVVEDMTLYASWSRYNIYKISFIVGEGATAVLGETVQYVNAGERAKTIEATRPNYKLDDWYIDSAYTIKFNFNEPPTKNYTLYAKWDEDWTVFSDRIPTESQFTPFVRLEYYQNVVGQIKVPSNVQKLEIRGHGTSIVMNLAVLINKRDSAIDVVLDGIYLLSQQFTTFDSEDASNVNIIIDRESIIASSTPKRPAMSVKGGSITRMSTGTGDGRLTIRGAKGTQGTSSVRNGDTGGTALVATGNFSITGSTISIYGGDGGNGVSNDSGNGNKGGNGGEGGIAIVSSGDESMLTITSARVTGGMGGTGGRGHDFSGSWPTWGMGGYGGSGSKGGTAIKVHAYSSTSAIVTGGTGGTGGLGGWGWTWDSKDHWGPNGSNGARGSEIVWT